MVSLNGNRIIFNRSIVEYFSAFPYVKIYISYNEKAFALSEVKVEESDAIRFVSCRADHMIYWTKPDLSRTLYDVTEQNGLNCCRFLGKLFENECERGIVFRLADVCK